jgi:hypothetical protein
MREGDLMPRLRGTEDEHANRYGDATAGYLDAMLEADGAATCRRRFDALQDAEHHWGRAEEEWEGVDDSDKTPARWAWHDRARSRLWQATVDFIKGCERKA